MKRKFTCTIAVLIFGACAMLYYAVWAQRNAAAFADDSQRRSGFDAAVLQNSLQMVEDGRKIFRFDTFGDRAFWGETLKLHQAIEGAGLGGVGPGVSPKTALAVGLKVDVDARFPAVWCS